VVLPDSLRGRRNFAKTPKVGPQIKYRISAKDDNPEGELDSAVDVRRRYKNSSILSCIGKRTKEGFDRGSKLWTVHSGAGSS